jgi:uncharacterized protein (TIGR00730 family)
VRSICVFCGSRPGTDVSYTDAARSLGTTLAAKGITLVYGGAHVGLMGMLADAAMKAGGEVVGVMPRALVEREISHTGLTELHIVGSMHERKALMAELSDGFMALPGGTGTLEEFFEVLTWANLGEHRKPCGLLNVSGYYDPLLALFDHMVEKGFLTEEHRAMVLVASEATDLLDAFSGYAPPSVPKWIGASET